MSDCHICGILLKDQNWRKTIQWESNFVFRWFKFTLKPPIVVAIGNLGHFLLE